MFKLFISPTSHNKYVSIVNKTIENNGNTSTEIESLIKELVLERKLFEFIYDSYKTKMDEISQLSTEYHKIQKEIRIKVRNIQQLNRKENTKKYREISISEVKLANK